MSNHCVCYNNHRAVLFFLFLSSLCWMASVEASSSYTVLERTTAAKKPSHNEQQQEEEEQVIVRFYFVRHGQTQANLDGIVVGQLDSKLTDLGMQQAQAAGRSKLFPAAFWRRYTSDLGRAQHSAQLVLQSWQNAQQSQEIETLVVEKRLRERAKGVREGLSKKLNYNRAMQHRRDANQDLDSFLYESEDDVWERVEEFLHQVVGDAVRDYFYQESLNHQVEASSNRAAAEMEMDTNRGAEAESATTIAKKQRTTTQQSPSSPPRIYCVFCLSHSGALRAVIRKLVASQLPASVDLTPAGKDGAKPGMLYIPNTSITVVDIVPTNLKEWISNNKDDNNKKKGNNLWTARLVELTRADHLDAFV